MTLENPDNAMKHATTGTAPAYRALPYLLLTLAVLFWAGNFIVGRAVRADIPPMALAFWRWFFAALIMCVWAGRRVRADWPEIRKGWKILLLLACTGVASFNTLTYLGLQWTEAINALIMQSIMPVIIVALSYLMYRERITLLQGLGILISLIGVLTIIVRGDLAILLSLSVNRGDLLALLAVILYAVYSVLLRKRPAIHPLSTVTVTFVIGVMILLPLYLFETMVYRGFTVSRPVVLSIGYVAIFPSIVSYLCYNRGVEMIGANRAGLFIHLIPVFGSLLAIVFLGEMLSWFHGIGILLIAAGIWLAMRARHSSPAERR